VGEGGWRVGREERWRERVERVEAVEGECRGDGGRSGPWLTVYLLILLATLYLPTYQPDPTWISSSDRPSPLFALLIVSRNRTIERTDRLSLALSFGWTLDPGPWIGPSSVYTSSLTRRRRPRCPARTGIGVPEPSLLEPSLNQPRTALCPIDHERARYLFICLGLPTYSTTSISINHASTSPLLYTSNLISQPEPGPGPAAHDITCPYTQTHAEQVDLHEVRLERYADASVLLVPDFPASASFLSTQGDMCIDADLFYSFFSSLFAPAPLLSPDWLAGWLSTFTPEPRTSTSSCPAQRNTLRNWGTCDDHGPSPRNNSDDTIDRILFGTTSYTDHRMRVGLLCDDDDCSGYHHRFSSSVPRLHRSTNPTNLRFIDLT
jgi:hypothetical protein